MKLNSTSYLALAAATATAVLSTSSAYGMSLRSDRPDLFNTFNSLVNTERLQKDNVSLLQLNPESLRWTKGAEPVDVFFINEGAGYRNQLFYTANGGEKQMIFGDIASPESILKESNGPLKLGDGVSLGKFTGNTSLDFLIKANGANNSNGKIYGANASLNADRLDHVIAYEYFDTVEKEKWVILGFEDLYGVHYNEGGSSDRDFNDVVIAIRGVTGSAITASVPEPSSTAAVLGLAALGMTRLLRSKKEVS